LDTDTPKNCISVDAFNDEPECTANRQKDDSGKVICHYIAENKAVIRCLMLLDAVLMLL
jgi:hypothetical protein